MTLQVASHTASQITPMRLISPGSNSMCGLRAKIAIAKHLCLDEHLIRILQAERLNARVGELDIFFVAIIDVADCKHLLKHRYLQ